MKKWYEERKIPLLGFIAFLIMMSFLTIIFNWFWSGLGTDPTHYVALPFTTDFAEFKDYATLYIPLISFGASLFAGLVVFLVFNDWKEQHNKSVESTHYTEALNKLKEISTCVNDIKNIVDEFGMDINQRGTLLADKYISSRKFYLKNLNDLQNQIIFIDLMQQNKDLETIIFPYISEVKLRITALDCDENTLFQMDRDFDLLYNHIRDESTFHGNLIKNNLKTMVDLLHSKIKA